MPVRTAARPCSGRTPMPGASTPRRGGWRCRSCPEEMFLDSVRGLVRADIGWIPPGEEGALYLRPFMFASEAFLGMRLAARYLYVVMASPVGSYFKGAPSISLWVTREYTPRCARRHRRRQMRRQLRRQPVAQAEAVRNGCDQVVFLDAIERRWVEELGGMNIFFVFDDGSLATPPLSGTILAGITRDSIITLARGHGSHRARRALFDRAMARGCGERPADRGLRLRHRRRGHRDRQRHWRGRRLPDRRPVRRARLHSASARLWSRSSAAVLPIRTTGSRRSPDPFPTGGRGDKAPPTPAGASPSGKAPVFGTGIRRFESCRPSQIGSGRAVSAAGRS